MNAVIGDYLEQQGSALAIRMAFYREGRPFPPTREALNGADRRVTSRVVIFVHGMAQTEACWSFRSEPASSYGALLERELGLTPFYVRYNTGRRIAHNGWELASLIGRLIDEFPIPVREVTLIGHSMGGLVIRSACHCGAARGQSWVRLTNRAIYLGSPHLGSPWEKAGHLVSLALGVSQNPIVRLTRSVSNLRSAGIQDLRHGDILEPESLSVGAPGQEELTAVPLCSGMDHYFVAGTLTESETHPMTLTFGDALVRLSSASAPGRVAGLPPEHFAVFPGLGHMELSKSARVYAKLREWFDVPPKADAAGLAVEVLEPSLERAPTPATSAEPNDNLLDAYLTLFEEATLHGVNAIQDIQEEFTLRPYGVLEAIPPIQAPAQLLREAHVAGIRSVYATIRLVTRMVSSVAHEGVKLLKKPSS